MRILLTNDDGILAPGLTALAAAVREMGPLSIVAPDSPQSAAGRSLTLHGPVLCRKVEVDGTHWGIGVAGRPVDCVKLAFRELLRGQVDLVLAGINAGANVGVNIFYSGTVAAAAEGALLGVPAVAFSLAGRGQMDYDRAARYCRWVLDGLLAGGLARGQLVNVNVPPLTPEGPRGVRFVPMSTAAITESYTRADHDSGGWLFTLNEYYEHGPQESETDVAALAEGFITVTPLHSDLTDHKQLAQMDKAPWPDLPRE